jgi:truncated hemoglobin YjbI
MRLWAHECSRVFYDRLSDDDEMEAFFNLIVEASKRELKQDIRKICKEQLV